MNFVVVRRRCGPWDFTKPMEQQLAWREHADFMDRLHSAGVMPLAGPMGGDRKVLMVVSADSEDEVTRLFATDPWTELGLLQTKSIEVWTVRIGSLD